MSICPAIGEACSCQPDDGMPCEWTAEKINRARIEWRTIAINTQAELDALRLELENSKATEASLRARCAEGEALLREVRIIVPEQYETRDRIDAHLKGAGQ